MSPISDSTPPSWEFSSAELAVMARELREATRASRVTIRLRGVVGDLPVVAEALDVDTFSMRDDDSYDLLAAATVQDLLSRREILVQDDCLSADPRPPTRLMEQYGVTAQMLAPVFDAAELVAIVSVHATGGLRNWTEADIEDLRLVTNRLPDVLQRESYGSARVDSADGATDTRRRRSVSDS